MGRGNVETEEEKRDWKFAFWEQSIVQSSSELKLSLLKTPNALKARKGEWGVNYP